MDNDINYDQVYNKENEILFWKVFHNKYLLYLIFHQIEIIGGGNGTKFKDIQNHLEFYSDKSALLKCKLEAGEIFEADRWSMSSLYFSQFGKEGWSKKINDQEYEDEYITSRNEYKKGDEYFDHSIEKEKQEKQDTIDALNFRQSFLILMKNNKLNRETESSVLNTMIYGKNYYRKKDEYEPFTIEETQLDEIILNEILLNGHENLIDTSNIKHAINCSSPFVLEKLLSFLKSKNQFDNVINDEIKNNSFSFVGEENMEPMFEFILNSNGQLYNLPMEHSNKRIKLTTGLRKTITKQQQPNDLVTKIDVCSLFLINSTSLQNKLLQLNLVKPGRKYYQEFSKEFIDQVLEILDNSNYRDGDDNEIEIRIKSLFQLYSREIEEVYHRYVYKYGEVIDGLNDDIVMDYTMHTKNVNCLKYLLSTGIDHLKDVYNSKDIYNPQRIPYYKLDYVKAISRKVSIENLEFIKLITKSEYFDGFYNIRSNILDYIFSIDSAKEFELVSKSIIRTNENSGFTDFIPEKWSDISFIDVDKLIGSKRFLIQDINSIDKIFKEFNYLLLFYKHKFQSYTQNGKIIYFKFESTQLIEYALEKYGSDSIFFKLNEIDITSTINGIGKSFYLYPFTRAINNCDLQNLKHIDQLLSSENETNFKFNKFEGSKSIDEINISKMVLNKMNQVKSISKVDGKHFYDKIKINFNYLPSNQDNNEKIKDLLNHLNESGWKLFSSNLFNKFINDISKLDKSIVAILLNLKINIEQFQPIQLLLNSISKSLNPNVTQFILENSNPFIKVDDIINEWEQNHKNFNETSYIRYGNDEWEYLSQSSLFYIADPGDNYRSTAKSFESELDIIKSIESLLNFISGGSDKENANTVSIIQKLVNYLFKRLIKVYQININTVKQTYQLIQSKWLSNTKSNFQFQHSLYHVLFYLSIRSTKLTDYINSLEEVYQNLSLDDYLESFDIKFCNYEDPNYHTGDESNQTNNLKSLKPAIFSFDFIFNSPLNSVFNELKQRLNDDCVEISKEEQINEDKEEQESENEN